MSDTAHLLRNRWLVSYLPFFTSETVANDYGGDWERASADMLEELDWMTSVEETWSTVNSLPRIQNLNRGSAIVIAREGKTPSFEVFPNGSRLIVSLNKPPALEMGLETIIAATLGELMPTSEETGEPVCDIIRLSARPKGNVDTLRAEVWLNDTRYAAAAREVLQRAMSEHGVESHRYTIAEEPFRDSAHAGSPASPAARAPAPAATTTTATPATVPAPPAPIDPKEASKRPAAAAAAPAQQPKPEPAAGPSEPQAADAADATVDQKDEPGTEAAEKDGAAAAEKGEEKTATPVGEAAADATAEAAPQEEAETTPAAPAAASPEPPAPAAAAPSPEPPAEAPADTPAAAAVAAPDTETTQDTGAPAETEAPEATPEAADLQNESPKE